MARACEFAMYLVGDYRQSVFQTDFPDPDQFITGPDTARRVVRVAQYHHSGIGLGRSAFEVVKIDGVCIVFVYQWIQ